MEKSKKTYLRIFAGSCCVMGGLLLLINVMLLAGKGVAGLILGVLLLTGGTWDLAYLYYHKKLQKSNS